MKKSIGIGLFSLAMVLSSQAMAAGGCDALVERLSSQIQNNGVPASGFNLEVVPAAQASQTRGEVIGNCENRSRLVVYTRTGRDYSTSASTSTSTSTSSSGATNSSAPAGGSSILGNSQPGSFQGSVPNTPQGTSGTPDTGEAPSDSLQSAE